jgi:hypothetical protein
MNNQQLNFLGRLRDIPPEEFRAQIEAAERAVQKRKAVRSFAKQLLIGMVIGLAIGGSMAALVNVATRGGF